MADFTIPATWELDGQTGNTQVVYVVDGHTVSENYQVLFDRVVPQVRNGLSSFAEYRIRIRRTHVDADGVPLPGVSLVDTKIRWNIEAPAIDVKAMISLLGSITADVELASDVVDSLRLPR